MNNRQELVGEKYLQRHILENEPDYVKFMIRDWKHNLLDHILDKAHHRRYWVISFREEWLDAHLTSVYWYHNAESGDKVVRLYGSIMEAQTEHVVVPEMPDLPQPFFASWPTPKLKWFTWHQTKLVFLVLILLAALVLTTALIAQGV